MDRKVENMSSLEMRRNSNASEHEESNSLGNLNSDRIKKKKKNIEDLMALRQMKAFQNSRLHFGGVLGSVGTSLTTSELQPYLERTILKHELDATYGKHGVTKAAEHFTSLSKKLQRPNNGEEVEVQRKEFIDKLNQRRKSKLNANRTLRLRKQQILVDKQLELSQHTSYISEDTLGENLPKLIFETKKNLPAMEQSLKLMKLKHARDLSTTTTNLIRSRSFEDFLLTHKHEVEVVQWILNLVIENVSKQCASSNLADAQLLELLLLSDQEQHDELQLQLIRSDVALDILNEIITDTCATLTKNFCEECIHLAQIAFVFSEDAFINGVLASVKKSKKPPEKKLESSFLSIKSSRNYFRHDIWSHTQPTKKEELSLQMPTSEATPAPVFLDATVDSEIISSEKASPKLETKFGNSSDMLRYFNSESAFWKDMLVETTTSSISKLTLKVSYSCITSDHSLLAIGSSRGDILIYNMTWDPPYLACCVSYDGKYDDPIMSMDWTLDYSRLVSLSSKGCIIVWSVSLTPYVSVNNLISLDYEVSSTSFNSQQLSALCVLESSQGDLQFKQGNLIETVGGSSLPSLVSFHYGLSFAATQDSIILALTNGDIIKCNLFNIIQQHCTDNLMINAQSHGALAYVLGPPLKEQSNNKIGQELPAELFRYHKCPLLRVNFIKNTDGTMISIDSNFNICQWKEESKYVNSFGWFMPYRKCNLSFVEEILIPKGADQIIFEDIQALKKSVKGKKTKSKQVVEQERRQALKELQTMQILNISPWHTDELSDNLEEKNQVKKPSKFITRIYAPSDDHLFEASAGGAVFTVLTLIRDSGVLVKYALRTYESSTAPAIHLLHSALAPCGDRMYFMLLYDEYLPKVRKHVTFIDLDMKTMQLGLIGPIQININSETFDCCKEGNSAHFFLSRVVETSGTDYIISNIAGKLYVHSVLSGRKVAFVQPSKRLESEKEVGLILPSRLRKLDPGSYVMLLNPDGNMMHIVTLPLAEPRSSATASMLKIVSQDTESHSSVTLSYKTLFRVKKELEKSSLNQVEIGWHYHEQNSMMKGIWTCRHMPLRLYMMLMVNTVVDIAVARSTGQRITQEIRKKLWKNDWSRMQNYFKDSL
ncbi:uncharacterized protein LOC143470820 [Clavelina lepadiformis]|uniref:uncharacterized protein LOC143470820 n=1 Tax=Clavelina lepadiformis TaxID=159417 RepID=UPI004041993D